MSSTLSAKRPKVHANATGYASTPSPHTSLATLSSLPSEILIQIASHLPLPSALSYALISRRFTPCAERRIWRDLDLTGFSACLQEPPGLQDDEDRPANVHKAILKTKLRDVMLYGNRRTLGVVESLEISPRPGFSESAILTLLELVSTNLRSLEMVAAIHCYGWKSYSRHDHATLDLPILDSDLHFPSLTHLTIGKRSIAYTEFLPIICNAAPNLIFLDVDIAQPRVIPLRDEMLDIPLPEFERDTKIRYLRIDFGYWDPRLRENAFEGHEPLPLHHPILSLLRHCPATERLSIAYSNFVYGAGDMFSYFLVAMQNWQSLWYVDWQTRSGRLWNGWDDPCEGREQDFSSLRVCVLEPLPLVEMFVGLPAGPNLELVYFIGDVKFLSDPDPPTPYPVIPPRCLAKLDEAQSLTWDFASQIRSSPKLRYISFGPDPFDDSGLVGFEDMDVIIDSGESMGYVDSYLHQDGNDYSSELIRVRLFLDVVEVKDYSNYEERPETERSPTETGFDYDVRSDDERYKGFEQLPEAVWQDFTWFKGHVIPLDIIEEMRDIDGRGIEEWEQRRVAVGDEAWSVLTRWIESVENYGVGVVTPSLDVVPGGDMDVDTVME